MKKIPIIILVGIIVTRITVLSVSAQDSTLTPQQQRLNTQQQRQELRQENQEQRQENRHQRRSDIAGNHADRLEYRLQIYYPRLQQLVAKIQNQINRLSDDGNDMTRMQNQLDTVKENLRQANALWQQSINEFRAINPDDYQTQRTQALTASDHVQQARRLFVQVVQDLKEIVRRLKTY